MLEIEVETHLRHEVEKLGGLCEKLEHVRGAPDRMVTWPYLGMELVETKRPSGKLEPHQRRDHHKRALRGTKVITLYTKEQVDAYIAERRIKINYYKCLPLATLKSWHGDVLHAAALVMERAKLCDPWGNDRTAKAKSKEPQANLPL